MISLLGVLLLTGCTKEGVKTCKARAYSVEKEMIFSYIEDTVKKEETKLTIDLNDMKLNKNVLDLLKSELADIYGLKLDLKYDEDKAFLNLTIDYETVDLEQLEALGLVKFDDKNRGEKIIGMQATIDNYESIGYECE